MEEELSNGCKFGYITRTMLIGLKDEFAKFYNNDFKEVKDGIKMIKNILNSRPSWPVSIIMTILSSVCIGLIVAFAKVLRGG